MSWILFLISFNSLGRWQDNSEVSWLTPLIISYSLYTYMPWCNVVYATRSFSIFLHCCWMFSFKNILTHLQNEYCPGHICLQYTFFTILTHTTLQYCRLLRGLPFIFRNTICQQKKTNNSIVKLDILSILKN